MSAFPHIVTTSGIALNLHHVVMLEPHRYDDGRWGVVALLTTGGRVKVAPADDMQHAVRAIDAITLRLSEEVDE